MARLGEPLTAPNPRIRKNRPVYAASRISQLRKSSSAAIEQELRALL